jgi:hypothetical protein
MTTSQKARKIVRDYEADKITGAIAFGFKDEQKPIELVYYSDRKSTIEKVREKLDSGAFCIGWVGVGKSNRSLKIRVPKEMKPHYASAVEHLARIADELLARDPRRQH